MLVCKSFLAFPPPLIKSIDWTYPPLDQKTFERFAKTYRNFKQLSIEQECDDDLPMLDWSKVSFPHLTYLSLSCSPVKSFEFDMRNTPALEQLSVSHQGPDSAAQFKLELPHLESLFFEHSHVSSTSAACCSHSRMYYMQLRAASVVSCDHCETSYYITLIFDKQLQVLLPYVRHAVPHLS